MGIEQLSLDAARQMFQFVARRIVMEQEALTQADRAIGDGDHGVGMARGFEAVQVKLDSREFASLGELFKTVGTALMTSIGGAAGAVFGTLFRSGARRLELMDTFDTQALAFFLEDGLLGVQERGKAKPGDKTLVDVLSPVASKAAEMVSEPLDSTLAALVAVAEQAVEDTRHMVATVGKAKTLGERSLGYPDPGALSMFLILKFMAEYLELPAHQPGDDGH
jgi:dihydroxyacetone kinase-like protein